MTSHANTGPEGKIALSWNGETFAPCAGVSPWDRGLRYGMSAFESFPVFAGKPHWWDRHAARLADSAHACGLRVPEAALDHVADAFLATGFTGFGRVYLTGGDERSHTGQVLLLGEPRDRPSRPYRLHADPREWHPTFPGRKTGMYWANLLRRAEALARGFDDALLIGSQGVVISAATANVFLKNDVGYLTPSLASGARCGVVREWVLSRLPVEEDRLHWRHFWEAKAIFVTNHWIGIRQVAALDGRAFAPDQDVAEVALEWEHLVGWIPCGKPGQ